MKYRTKLTLVFFLIAGTSSGLVTWIEIKKTRHFLFRELQAKAIAIAATTASQIDGDALKKMRNPEDQDTPDYIQMKNLLWRARDANREGLTYVAYLFAVYPDPKNPRIFHFGIGTEPIENGLPHFGTISEIVIQQHLPQHLDKPYAFDRLTKDQWGDWLSAYAPVFDSQGQYAGTIGVAISAVFIGQHLNILYWYGLLAFGLSMLFSFLVSSWIAKHSSRNIQLLEQATIEITQGHFAYRVNLPTHAADELKHLATSMNAMSQSLEEKERLKSGFARYVSQHILEKILASKGSLKLEGERRKVTVLFSDIKNFTHFSETMEPEKLFAFLNEYFTVMLDIIFKYNGMLDKMIGDGIMAEFGAPVDDPKQEKNSVLAAIDMQKALIELREKWKKEDKPAVEVGIGIHTGLAVVGSIGSEKRMEYTAIGDTVNTASRLEGMTREVNHTIIISETTYAAVQNEFKFTNLGPKMLKGKDKPIQTYAVEWDKSFT